jgi:acyl-lipid omega-6 desaturase (Delta-12 desaturase)
MEVLTKTETLATANSNDLSEFNRSSVLKPVWQIVNSIGPYAGCWALMIYLIQQEFPFWLYLLISVPAAGFLVRIFIIFHDCCHRSFFVSSTANAIFGYIFGIFIFTPYEKWRSLHLKHHGTTGNLDKRGTGDIWTLTVEEYKTASTWDRLLYRVVRNPLLMLGLGPITYFLISQRIWYRKANRKQILSVMLTNVILGLIIYLSHLTFGLATYLVIQIPIILIAGAAGIWLFYVQHQFEGVYWARQEDWDRTRAAMEGSSFYKLPRILQWISGNIGFHHIHHIRPQIPNYNLESCFNKYAEFQSVKSITLRKSIKSLFLNLWDEQQGKLISFRTARSL